MSKKLVDNLLNSSLDEIYKTLTSTIGKINVIFKSERLFYDLTASYRGKTIKLMDIDEDENNKTFIIIDDKKRDVVMSDELYYIYQILRKYPGLKVDKDCFPVLNEHKDNNKNQVLHANNFLEKLKTNVGIQEGSGTGCGKTFIMIYIARKLNLPIFLVAPPGVLLEKWKELAIIFNVKVISILSYGVLAGQRGKDVSHGYLNRQLVKSDNKRGVNEFRTSKKFNKAVKKEMLLIFDESHWSKNKKSSRSLASYALCKEVARQFKANKDLKTRIAVVSASPGDKAEQAISLCKMLGLVTQDTMYNWNIGTREMEYTGYKDLIDYCKNIDKEKTSEITSRRSNYKKKEIETTIFELYTELIKYQVTQELVLKREGKYNNIFCKLNKEDNEKLSLCVKGLKEIINLDGTSEGYGKIEAYGLGRYQLILGEAEAAKINKLAQRVTSRLQNTKNNKMVIYVNKRDSIERLVKILSEYTDNVLQIHGNVSIEDRIKVMKSFQAPNNKCRVLIVMLGVGIEGLDYDDKDGRFIREVFYITKCHFIKEYQATGRVDRMDTKSIPIINNVFAQGDNEVELKLLDLLAQKTMVGKKLKLNEPDVPFPGDFTPLYEVNDEMVSKEEYDDYIAQNPDYVVSSDKITEEFFNKYKNLKPAEKPKKKPGNKTKNAKKTKKAEKVVKNNKSSKSSSKSSKLTIENINIEKLKASKNTKGKGSYTVVQLRSLIKQINNEAKTEKIIKPIGNKNKLVDIILENL